MKTTAIIFLCFLAWQSLATAQVTDSLNFKTLHPKEFADAFKSEEKAVLIDVREFFEYRKSRIRNAINIPSYGNLEVSADTLSRGSALFFYCTSGVRSKRVSKYFCKKGFTNVYNLDGGISGWRKEKLPVDKKRLSKKDTGHASTALSIDGTEHRMLRIA